MLQITRAFIFVSIVSVAIAGCAPKPLALDRSIDDFREHPGLYTHNGESFWWGVSTSSYQIEDASDEFKTDWDICYSLGRLKHPREQGTGSYTEWRRDLEALKSLSVTHYRFSIEWARIEPQPGVYDQAAIEHYIAQCKALKEAGITPVVTLWHFTFPCWLADSEDALKHGWLHPDARNHWEDYVRMVVPKLAPYVTTWCPQNEPNAYALAVLLGWFPPAKGGSYKRYLADQETSAEAFIAAAKIIREFQPDARIVSVQNIVHWKKDPLDIGRFWYNKSQEYNFGHLDKIKDSIDWVGFNYYAGEVASPLVANLQGLRFGENVSDMGWLIDPMGFEKMIDTLAERYGKPILITENGLSDQSDRKRPMYLLSHLRAVQRAIRRGRDVRGYFHWTLVDNYEWAQGYTEHFGLFVLSSDRTKLLPRDSAELYRLIIRGSRAAPVAAEPSLP